MNQEIGFPERAGAESTSIYMGRKRRVQLSMISVSENKESESSTSYRYRIGGVSFRWD